MKLRWLQPFRRGRQTRTGDDAADDPKAAALGRFRVAVNDALAREERAPLAALLQMRHELGLAEEEVELEFEMIRGALDLIAVRDAVLRDGLPVLEHQHKALGADRCHFRAPASMADDANQSTGRLFVTDRRLIFLVSPLLALPWSRVTSVDADERDIVVRAVPAGTVYRFRCNSFSDARCGAFIAGRLAAQGALGSPNGPP